MIVAADRVLKVVVDIEPQIVVIFLGRDLPVKRGVISRAGGHRGLHIGLLAVRDGRMRGDIAAKVGRTGCIAIPVVVSAGGDRVLAIQRLG